MIGPPALEASVASEVDAPAELSPPTLEGELKRLARHAHALLGVARASVILQRVDRGDHHVQPLASASSDHGVSTPDPASLAWIRPASVGEIGLSCSDVRPLLLLNMNQALTQDIPIDHALGRLGVFYVPLTMDGKRAHRTDELALLLTVGVEDAIALDGLLDRLAPGGTIRDVEAVLGDRLADECTVVARLAAEEPPRARAPIVDAEVRAQDAALAAALREEAPRLGVSILAVRERQRTFRVRDDWSTCGVVYDCDALVDQAAQANRTALQYRALAMPRRERYASHVVRALQVPRAHASPLLYDVEAFASLPVSADERFLELFVPLAGPERGHPRGHVMVLGYSQDEHATLAAQPFLERADVLRGALGAVVARIHALGPAVAGVSADTHVADDVIRFLVEALAAPASTRRARICDRAGRHAWIVRSVASAGWAVGGGPDPRSSEVEAEVTALIQAWDRLYDETPVSYVALWRVGLDYPLAATPDGRHAIRVSKGRGASKARARAIKAALHTTWVVDRLRALVRRVAEETPSAAESWFVWRSATSQLGRATLGPHAVPRERDDAEPLQLRLPAILEQQDLAFRILRLPHAIELAVFSLPLAPHVRAAVREVRPLRKSDLRGLEVAAVLTFECQPDLARCEVLIAHDRADIFRSLHRIAWPAVPRGAPGATRRPTGLGARLVELDRGVAINLSSVIGPAGQYLPAFRAHYNASPLGKRRPRRGRRWYGWLRRHVLPDLSAQPSPSDDVILGVLVSHVRPSYFRELSEDVGYFVPSSNVTIGGVKRLTSQMLVCAKRLRDGRVMIFEAYAGPPLGALGALLPTGNRQAGGILGGSRRAEILDCFARLADKIDEGPSSEALRAIEVVSSYRGGELAWTPRFCRALVPRLEAWLAPHGVAPPAVAGAPRPARLESVRTYGGIETLCAKMSDIIDALQAVAVGAFHVLLTGETGVGKGVAARAIHDHSGRAGEFIHVNAATIPKNLAEAELFGAVVGGYHEARNRKGQFALADGGTFFLDEIGELPLDVQAKLLTAIETGYVKRVGAERGQRFDVRVIAATTRDLEAEIRDGRFRSELYYRFKSTLELPPLRDRLDDLPLLLKALAPDHRFTAAALADLGGYAWPGNIRQLEGVVAAALERAGDGPVDRSHLGLRKLPAPAGRHAPPPGARPAFGAHLDEVVERLRALVTFARQFVGPVTDKQNSLPLSRMYGDNAAKNIKRTLGDWIDWFSRHDPFAVVLEEEMLRLFAKQARQSPEPRRGGRATG